GQLDEAADPDDQPAEGVLNGLHQRIADIEPVDAVVGRLDQLHERRAGAVHAAGKLRADGNCDIPELVADEVEPHGQRGDDPAQDDIGDDGPHQLGDARAAPAG